jgi:CBS domain-containing protein
MLAKDLMRRQLFTIGEDEPVCDLIDVLVREHIHGVPVLDGEHRLSGVVTQQDIFFAGVMKGPEPGKRRPWTSVKVRDIMTAPAISADEDTDLVALCRMMSRLRIHRLPIVREGQVTGIISSLDICAALGRGELEL